MSIPQAISFQQVLAVYGAVRSVTRAGRAPYEPPGGGSCGGLPPLFARRRWVILANDSGAQINKPKLAWPAAQAKALHRLRAAHHLTLRSA